MTEFTRPKEGFRFRMGGMKTNAAPDALPPGKYPYLQNVRALGDDYMRTRPGQTRLFATGGQVIAGLRAYAGLFTDDLPRLLACDALGKIWLDNAVQVGALAEGEIGASMIPFRPAESPNPYMYVGNVSDYQKFSAPDLNNNVIQQKVGIAEPQSPPQACLAGQYQSFIFDALEATGDWTGSGVTIGTPSTPRVTATVGAILQDPQGDYTSIEVAYGSLPASAFQRWMEVQIAGNSYIVQDVIQPITNTSTPFITIEAIYYYSGTTGQCVIVPQNQAPGPGAEGTPISQDNILGNLRRGSIISLGRVAIGNEFCYVQDVVVGPDGTVCIETSTVDARTTADTISGVFAISLLAAASAFTTGDSITSPSLVAVANSGVNTATATLASNPFIPGGNSFQPDDYFHLSLMAVNLNFVNEIKVLIDVGDGSFTENFYYFTIRPSDILQATQNTLTQLAAAQTVTQRAIIDQELAVEARAQGKTVSSLQTAPGDNQWSEIVFPISSFTRVGSDQTRNLMTAGKIQLLFNLSSGTDIYFGSITVFGGYEPDVGDVGAPYLYRVRPRSSLTGAVGNPSPATRAGCNPRRQLVIVTAPSAAYDPQIDTWDVFRYGGAVTSWRYIGFINLATGTTLNDNFSDDAAQGGDELDFDNFEPWPSIDLPLTPATYGPGSSITATVTGITALVTVPGLSTSSRGFPQITSWLPGTLVQFNDGNVYTLWARPTFVSGGSGFPSTYLFQFVENAGAATNISVTVQEPIVANQHLPYLWGPDAGGTVFAVGDQLRPGTLYFSKNFAPDSAPDTYNIELSPPSEPLLGGEIMDGLGFVASSRRWWALYPQPDNPAQRYNAVQMPFTHGLAAPFGHCTDGKDLYWWADDGIYSSERGSLTDADLYNLFPHDGVVGQNVTYAGFTAFAPDYSRAGAFRLAWQNSFLYAVYLDTTGAYRMLVCDLSRGRVAWSIDTYSPTVSLVYAPEQQAGTVQSETTRYPALLFGSISGQVSSQTDLTNDLTNAITGVVATAEFDSGDARAPKFWGDLFMDITPAAQTGVNLTPMSLGAQVQGPTNVPSNASRERIPIAAVGVSDFLGLLASWTDNFSAQAAATVLYDWQPSYAIQPVRMISFETMGTDFDLNGYMHIRQVAVAWISTAPITLAISTFDGQSPPVITIPSSGGEYQKALFPVGPNKGQLFFFEASSTAAFQLFFDDWEVYVGAWGRGDAYKVVEGMGGRIVEQSAA